MDIRDRLQANHKTLLELYQANLEDVLSLQATLIRDIMPSVTDELELGPDATEWANDYLQDTSSIFRTSKRNMFTRSFALESMQKSLVWRLTHLWPLVPPSPIPNVYCLPDNVRDPFGRPIIVIKVVAFDETSEVIKKYILQAFEQLRTHLRHLHDTADDGQEPPLQYIVLLDLAALSLQSFNIDLVTWTIREVIPRFPGMLGAVFVVNYSWAHSGMWSIVKHILPESALSRMFFPSKDELVRYFSSSALPQDYGGTLPLLTDLRDPLRPVEAVAEQPASESQYPPPETFVPTPAPTVFSLSPTSLLNPFYGYPALTSSSRVLPSLHHGRRRKRDLARTLAILFWTRWHTHITVSFCIALLVLAMRPVPRRTILRVFKGISSWKLLTPLIGR